MLKNEVVKVGETLVIIEVKGEVATPTKEILEVKEVEPQKEEDIPTPQESVAELEQQIAQVEETIKIKVADGKRFYSPLVRNIAKEEGIPIEELDQILGTGKDQRLTKKDLLSYLERRTSTPIQTPQKGFTPPPVSTINSSAVSGSGSDQFREMTRMENLIANHMMSSLKTSAHVQSFIEVDVTHLWDWREGVKDAFQKRENDKLTFTPLFMHAIIKALRDYPEMNSSIDGQKIILKKAINLGMATALPDGNLIVPVIKKCRLLKFSRFSKSSERSCKPSQIRKFKSRRSSRWNLYFYKYWTIWITNGYTNYQSTSGRYFSHWSDS